jgi:hypothetical protein
MAFKRWLYRGDRPHTLAKILNRAWAIIHALGISPNYFVTLEVISRKSGKIIIFPLVLVDVKGERYLVSMLGDNTNWVRNVRAAGGKATLRHGVTEEVRLEEIPVEQRAPIIKTYLKVAPGARPHIPVDKNAPLTAFEQIAPQFPVFVCKSWKAKKSGLDDLFQSAFT